MPSQYTGKSCENTQDFMTHTVEHLNPFSVSDTLSNARLTHQIIDPNFVKHVSQVPVPLYSVCTIPILDDAYTFSGKSNQYTQMLVQCPHIAVLYDLYIDLTEPHLNHCTCMGVVYHINNAQIWTNLYLCNVSVRWIQ